MKFTKIKKTLCFALAMAMLMAFVPMSALADEVTSQVLEVIEDAAISYNTADTPNVDGTTMRMNRNGNNAKWALMQFDLSEISVPEGKEIDSVTITAYLSSYTVSNKSTIINIYEGKLSCHPAPVEPTYDSTFTWNNYLNAMGVESAKAPTTTMIDEITLFEGCTAENPGTFSAPMKCEFDVTDYVVTSERTGNQSFIFYPNVNYVDAYFYTSENKETNSAVVPIMTVTFKDAAHSEPTDPGAPKTITTINDTYIWGKPADQGTTFATDDRLYCRREGSSSDVNKYGAWTMVQFNLGDIKPSEGYEIESAKIKLHVQSSNQSAAKIKCYAVNEEPSNYATVTWSSYAEQLGLTGGTMRMSPQSNSSNVMSEGVEVVLDGEITDGEAYEFDVTDEVSMMDLTGNQTFVFYPHNSNSAAIYFYSENTAAYEPSMTVTFKKAPAPTVTLNPLEMVIAAGSDAIAAGVVDTTNHIYQIRNFSNDHRAGTKMMFDLYEAIPEDKVVTKAELKVYVADTFMTETNNGLRVVNYKDNEWTRDNVFDSSEAGSVVAWDADAENARLAGDLSISGVAPLFDAEGKEIHDWVTVDVTEFISQQINTEDMVVSFFVTANKSENKTAKIYNAYSDLYAPQLVLTYEDASEQPALTIGTPTFSNPYTGETMTNFVGGNFLYANVPVSGYSAEGIEGKIILATYFADGSLRYIDEVNDFKFHAGNGSITFALTPQANATTTKVFVWDANNKSVSPAAGVITVESAVEAE